jgi:hypothetical protein
VSHGDIGSPQPAGETRPDNLLDSWKEIAAYLDREVRTVQRWEKKEGLPVHRQIHEKMGTVYAYKTEIDAWWKERSAKLASKGENGELAGGPRIVSWPDGHRAEEVTAAIPSHKVPGLAVYAVAVASVVALALGLYAIARVYDWRFLRKPPLEAMRIARLTFTGQVKDAAISPDGKYIAFVNLDSGARSVSGRNGKHCASGFKGYRVLAVGSEAHVLTGRDVYLLRKSRFA